MCVCVCVWGGGGGGEGKEFCEASNCHKYDAEALTSWSCIVDCENLKVCIRIVRLWGALGVHLQFIVDEAWVCVLGGGGQGIL